MKAQNLLFSSSFLFTFAFARPTPVAFGVSGTLHRREVPQEHSHEKFLTTVRASLASNNPAGIADPVFGLLGNAAAAGGQGSISDTNCLQQATADQAFTNAKAAKDVNGMTAALVYRTLERNTGTVGGVSAACTGIKAANQEIAALRQHQDPASANAAATNKAIALELAKQIASVGGDPQVAIESGTFAPGSTADKTGKGNTCDDANDATGCIFTQNLLVPDVTAAEIDAAVGSKTKEKAVGSQTKGNAAAGSKTKGKASSTSVSSTSTAAVSGAAAPGAVSADAPFSNDTSASNTTTGAATGAAKLDFGACTNPGIIFGPGFDGRKEDSFQPADTAQFTHGSALNIGVITGFIQDRLKDSCKASQQAIAAASSAAAATKGLKGQAAAEAWNKGLGLSSAAATPCPKPKENASSSPAMMKASSNKTNATTKSGNKASSNGKLDLGSCNDPSIEFGEGFDGRKEASFRPINKQDFAHGSADNIGVIAGFICQQLMDKCKANADALAACARGQQQSTATAAAAAKGGQAAADAFNNAFN